MAAVGQKLDNRQFEIATGVIVAIAVLLACARIYIKASKFHRLFTDDILFIFATLFLIGGTVTTCLVLPYNQTEIDISAGLIAPPPDLTRVLDQDSKFQDASAVLLNASIFSVKYSFLFFFRLLLHGTGKLRIWWWCVVIFTFPCAIICMCMNFMACPAFGDRIYAVCVAPSALFRQKATVYTTVTLDIASDLALISIPILFLWNVKINLRRKLGLGSLLCLSAFAILTNVIRLVGHELDNGQQDLVWIFFWGEMEACIAVIANSTTAFCALFAKGNSVLRPSQQHDFAHLPTQHNPRPRTSLRMLPSVALSGLRSFMLKDPFEDETMHDGRETLAPSGDKNIYALKTYSVNHSVPSDTQSIHQNMYAGSGLQNEDFV